MHRSPYRKLPHEVAFYFGIATPLARVSAIPTDYDYEHDYDYDYDYVYDYDYEYLWLDCYP